MKRFSLLAVSNAVDSNRALEAALCMKKEGGQTYNYVGEWLNYGIDSDGDGLLDDEERYFYEM